MQQKIIILDFGSQTTQLIGCMRYEAEDTLLELMDKDLESIAEALGSEKYSVIYKSEE